MEIEKEVKKKEGLIYRATNKVNGKVYIGQTFQTFKKRIKQHFDYPTNPYFANALKKYGEDGFVWDIIDRADSPEEVDDLEIKYIDSYDSTNPAKGYNCLRGGCGNGGRQPNLETRIKMSIAHGGQQTIYAKRLGEMKVFHTLVEACIFLDVVSSDLKDCCRVKEGYAKGWRVSFEDLSDYEDVRNKTIYARRDDETREFSSIEEAVIGLGIYGVGDVLAGRKKTLYGWYISREPLKKEDCPHVNEKKTNISFYGTRDGEILEFKSKRAAGRKLGINCGLICTVLNKKQIQTHGWWFSYDREELEGKNPLKEKTFYAKKDTEILTFTSRKEAIELLGINESRLTIALGKIGKTTGGYYFSCDRKELEEFKIPREKMFFGKKDGKIFEFLTIHIAANELNLDSREISKVLRKKITDHS